MLAAEDCLVVVHFAEHRAHQADSRVAIGEDSDDVGAPADLPRFNRSCGLLLQICFQCSLGQFVNESSSSVHSASICAACGNRGWSCSIIRACWARTDCASSRAKVLRTSVATKPCIDFGTRVGRFRMKCVRQRCQLAPRSTDEIASFSAGCASDTTRLDVLDFARLEPSQECQPARAVLDRDHVETEDLPAPFLVDPGRDQAGYSRRGPPSRLLIISASSQICRYLPLSFRSLNAFHHDVESLSLAPIPGSS